MPIGRRRVAAHRTRGAGDEGFSLVETLIAIVLFGLVAVAAGAMLLSGVQSSDGQRARAAAASVASSQLEADRHTAVASFTTLTPPGAATYTSTVAGRTFTTTRLTQWVPKVDAANACDAAANGQGGNNGVQPVLEVTETVTWQHMAGASPVVNQTTLTPPVGTYSSTSGAIDVGVTDSNNAAIASLPVTFQDTTANTTQTINTDSHGCAFAAFLPAGHQFKVSVSKTGYVDNNENVVGVSTCESGGTVAVTSGNVVSCPILYDQGVTVNWQYQSGCNYGSGVGTAMSSTQCPLPPELTAAPVVAIGNAGLSAPLQFAGTFTPVASGSTLLYPYSSYTMWAGHCSLSKPVSPPTSFTAKPSPVTPNPVVVPLYGAQLQVKGGSGGSTAYAVTSVTAKEAGTGNNCYPSPPGASTYTLSTPPGITGTTTSTSTTALPVGTYAVTVNYTKNGTAQTAKTTTIVVGYNSTATPNTGGTNTVLTLS